MLLLWPGSQNGADDLYHHNSDNSCPVPTVSGAKSLVQEGEAND